MNREELFELWESELTGRELGELALDFIESQTTAYGTTIKVDKDLSTATIHYDLQTEFREYLRGVYEESEEDREDTYEQGELWANHDVDDPHYQ